MPVPVPWTLPDLPAAARWSVAVRDGGTGAVLAAVHPDQLQLTASIGKVFLLVEVAARLADGSLDPEEPLTWTEEEHVADSGLWYLMDRRTLGVRDLAVLVGAFSDNLATNVLLRRVGLTAVQARAVALGCTRSTLLDRVRLRRTPQDPPTLSVGTAGELSGLLHALHAGTGVAPAVSAQVLRWLAAGADLSMVASAFDLDPLAHGEPDRGVTLVNKTGTISIARGDVGVVAGPDATLAYAVLATWPEHVDVRDAVLAAMRTVGQQLRAAVGG
ncbi:beta-lactamase class A [Friedmanniella luteola]|uniref:Beta-lactamase class A n=1 Tax=Friedmanniella luteola TaxID=546871 RepID=A0A1H1LZK5_9ACTN|nr:serine hydrolase [Friedmanniella luteola]SDR80004.1 beta-lactamase class A [Friedmanniella luteola]